MDSSYASALVLTVNPITVDVKNKPNIGLIDTKSQYIYILMH